MITIEFLEEIEFNGIPTWHFKIGDKLTGSIESKNETDMVFLANEFEQMFRIPLSAIKILGTLGNLD